MNSLIKTTIKRPVTICVLVVILLAVGVLATMDMSTNLLPNIKMPMLGVTVIYPGAGAQSVQDSVTTPVERSLQTVSGVTEIETRSYDNVSIAILTFNYGTDIDKKIDDISDAFKSVKFPQGCEEPSFVKIDMNGTAAATVSVYQDIDSPDTDLLAKDAEALAIKLRAIEGVGSVNVLGSPEKQIKITALQGLDITALALIQALTKENLDLPLGTIIQNGSVISIRNESNAKSVLEVMQLPVEMELGASVMSSLATVKSAVKTYATCTLNEFNDYVEKSRQARRAIDEIDGKSYEELNELQNNLSSVKSLMMLLRENSSQQLRLMWHWIDSGLVKNDEFKGMTDDDLKALAQSNQYGLSFETLKWIRDGAVNGDLETNWNNLVLFRQSMEYAELADDIPYEHFANLFQNGGVAELVTLVDPDSGKEYKELYEYNGLDILHLHDANCPDGDGCTKDKFDHSQAVDVCKFADSVNTVAFQNILDSVKQAEDNGEEPQISDEQFAALFVNSTQGNEFAALMSPQVIHIIRLDNFDKDVVSPDGTTKQSIVKTLTETKLKHVEEEYPDDPSADRKAVYSNGKAVAKNGDNEIGVIINDVFVKVDNFGRLINAEGKLIDEGGNVLTLSDEQSAENFYSYGGYTVFSTDGELLELYNKLNLDELDIGITPTTDTIGFIRKADITDNATKLIVPAAYVGKIEQKTTHQAYAEYNGRLAVTLEVYAVTGANTTKVVSAVKKAMTAVNVSEQCKVVLLDDKAEFINDSISNVLSSIVIGGVLAILVIYLFVGKIGSSLVVSITMPLSVLVALIGLWAMNISLNLVSLGGLAVGIGMLVDNSIVVLESITKHRDSGESVFDSCLNGTREVAGSLLASTLTNICVFFPILFAKGLTREIFYDLVWAVMFSIVMSLLVAVTVIPSLYHLIYNRSPRPRYKKDKDGNKVLVGTFEDGEPRGERKPLYDETSAIGKAKETETAESTQKTAVVTDSADGEKTEKKNKKRTKKQGSRAERKRNILFRMENGYGYILSKVLTKRIVVCVVALVLFAGSVGLVFTTGVDFIPSVDKGVIEVNLAFDGAATLEQVNDSTRKAVKAIRDKYGDNINYASYTVGKQGMLPMNITGVVRIHIDNSKLKTSDTVNAIRDLLQESDIDAKNIRVAEIDGVVAELTGEMAGQSVTLLSENEQALKEAAEKIEAKLWQINGVKTVTNNTPAQTRQYSFTFDKDACAHRNVDYQNAVLLLRVGMSGYDAATVTIDGDSQAVNVQFADETKDSLDALLNVVVGFDDDGAVKISDVLKKTDDGKFYKEDTVVTVVNRKDGKYVTTVDVESFGVDMGTITKAMREASLEVLKDYDDVEYSEGGVSYYLTDAMNGLVISLIAAFFLLYGVMACQFESLVKPFIVIMSIPFSFTGGFLALVITGTTLNVVSFVGIIMLMGVIVNGAIVMIDKIDQLIKSGKSPQEAVLEGCKSRLRPILMTTLTTILALIPLAIGLGRGSELMQPMGIVVIGGLLLGTLVTLVLIPCFYCIVKRVRFESPSSNKKHGKKSKTEAENESDVTQTEDLGEQPQTADYSAN